MRWSFRILTVAGIGIYVHITFLILILFVFSMYFGEGGSALAIHGTALVVAVFGCVLLHELGHALTAKRLGVRTRDIVLLPIGGVARLERIPREPWREFSITVAGPLVNVLIAGGLYLALCLLQLPAELKLDDFTTARSGGETFLRQLLEINIALVIFNLVPAFPMDGGRILRSLLALVMDHSRATRIAASVGQTLAIIFGIYGILNGHMILLLIAVFVYLGASAEAASSRMQTVFRGLPASAAVITRFVTLRPEDTLGAAVERLLSGSQADFPVLEEGLVLGVLTRRQLVSSLRASGSGSRLRDISLVPVSAVDAARRIG